VRFDRAHQGNKALAQSLQAIKDLDFLFLVFFLSFSGGGAEKQRTGVSQT
tara:strand:- start:405 stop:554 length:150 start_codon:yes stop_codon:yes gene_type:complete